MKRVLLTGAAGFVGRHAIAPLHARGYEVHAVSSKKMNEAQPGVIWHRSDLFDRAALARMMAEAKPTHLLHFAWYAEPGKFWESAENFRWVEASLALLQSFASHGGSRVVMAGTCAEYDWDYGYCRENITPCKPGTVYGVCKNSLQSLLHAFSKEHGLSSAWGRLFLLYGSHESMPRLVPSVIQALLKGEPARCSHGMQIRDFLHVQDVADAFVALLDSSCAGPVNIASGQPVLLKDIINTIARMMERPELVRLGAVTAPAHEPKLLVAETVRLNAEVGWSPSLTLEKGLRRTVDWWKTQKLLTKA